MINSRFKPSMPQRVQNEYDDESLKEQTELLPPPKPAEPKIVMTRMKQIKRRATTTAGMHEHDRLLLAYARHLEQAVCGNTSA
jgi:hypothetical protein